MTSPCNIAHTLVQSAHTAPEQIAIRQPHRWGQPRQDITFKQLNTLSDVIAAGLAAHGFNHNDRVVLMVRPSIAFFALVFALFKRGAIPVLIDPGIPVRALRRCLAEVQPQAMIGVALAQLARWFLRWAPSAKRFVTLGPPLGWGGVSLATILRAGAHAPAQMAQTAADDMAAILFTSGSTGLPKGVVYRHRHFFGQIDLLRQAFALEPGAINLPTFPPFALFDAALGSTSVLPQMDPRRPARANPRVLHHAIRHFGVTMLFGSPALMRVLADYQHALPTIRCAVSAGAPVPPELVTNITKLLPATSSFWTPYGATECLPLAVIEGRELAQTKAATQTGSGTCVGRVLAANTVRIIAICDDALPDWSDVHELAVGQIGEITVTGPTTTDTYYNRPQATALAKIREKCSDGQTRIVHRMGDVGYFDLAGRLWFCGRMSQRVESEAGVLFTEQVEPIFNTVAGVARTALVGIGVRGQQRPVLCFEPLPGYRSRAAQAMIFSALQTLAATHARRAPLKHFLCHRRFTVDIRHNAKINRESLALWAGQQKHSDQR